MKLRLYLQQQIKQNRWQFLIVTSVFVIGFFLGYYKIPALDTEVRKYLLQTLDNYLLSNQAGSSNGYGIFIYAFWEQLKSIGLIWFLGLTIIGFPLILTVVFGRGYSLGFTLGFLIQAKDVKGILILLLTVLPQNIIYIPFIIILAVTALNFSLNIVRPNRNPHASLSSQLLVYGINLVFFLAIFLIGAFVEGFLSPWLLSLFL